MDDFDWEAVGAAADAAQAASKGGGGGPSGGGWSCPRCTLRNDTASLECRSCGQMVPASRSVTAPAYPIFAARRPGGGAAANARQPERGWVADAYGEPNADGRVRSVADVLVGRSSVTAAPMFAARCAAGSVVAEVASAGQMEHGWVAGDYGDPDADEHADADRADYERFDHEVDREAMETWLYPKSEGYQVRDYQRNIVQGALLHNTLVVLPTGLGKTFIAAVLMYNYRRWFPSGKIIFMAPTKPLVAQQVEACHKIVGIPTSETAELTGTVRPAQRRRLWRDRFLFYCTPQTVDKDCQAGLIPLREVVLLVVDEAHRATGHYAYVNVVRELSSLSPHWRMLALSATPGKDFDKVQEIVTNLRVSKVVYKAETDYDVKPYVFTKAIEKVEVEMTSNCRPLLHKIEKFFTGPLQRLRAGGACPSLPSDPSKLTNAVCVHEMTALNRNPACAGPQLSKLRADLGLLTTLTHTRSLLLVHGLSSMLGHIERNIDSSSSKSKLRFAANAEWRTYVDELKRLRTAGWVNPKIMHLVVTLRDHFSRYAAAGHRTSVIVFSQYRDSVAEICDAIERETELRVSPFVGQASCKSKRATAGDDEDGGGAERDGGAVDRNRKVSVALRGQKQKEQQKIVAQFRANELDVLVATCIGEEGLDIGSVDLVVCFDCAASPVRMVQRFGRAGRKRAGRIMMLLAKGIESDKFEAGKKMSVKVNTVLRKKSHLLKMYDGNPRLVPSDISNPTFELCALAIHEYHSSQVGGHERKQLRTAAARGVNAGTTLGKVVAPLTSAQKRRHRELHSLSQPDDGRRRRRRRQRQLRVDRNVDEQMYPCNTHVTGAHSKRCRLLVNMVTFIEDKEWSERGYDDPHFVAQKRRLKSIERDAESTRCANIEDDGDSGQDTEDDLLADAVLHGGRNRFDPEDDDFEDRGNRRQISRKKPRSSPQPTRQSPLPATGADNAVIRRIGKSNVPLSLKPGPKPAACVQVTDGRRVAPEVIVLDDDDDDDDVVEVGTNTGVPPSLPFAVSLSPIISSSSNAGDGGQDEADAASQCSERSMSVPAPRAREGYPFNRTQWFIDRAILPRDTRRVSVFSEFADRVPEPPPLFTEVHNVAPALSFASSTTMASPSPAPLLPVEQSLQPASVDKSVWGGRAEQSIISPQKSIAEVRFEDTSKRMTEEESQATNHISKDERERPEIRCVDPKLLHDGAVEREDPKVVCGGIVETMAGLDGTNAVPGHRVLSVKRTPTEISHRDPSRIDPEPSDFSAVARPHCPAGSTAKGGTEVIVLDGAATVEPSSVSGTVEDEADVVCGVCNDPSSVEGDSIIFCDGCDLRVHQSCYGVRVIPQGEWLCDVCADVKAREPHTFAPLPSSIRVRLGVRGKAPTCKACLRRGGNGGPLRKALSGKKVCARCPLSPTARRVPVQADMLLIGFGCKVTSAGDVKPIRHTPRRIGWNAEFQHEEERPTRCLLCRNKGGFSVQCHHFVPGKGRCTAHFHASCALDNGLLFERPRPSGSPTDAKSFRVYCAHHSIERRESLAAEAVVDAANEASVGVDMFVQSNCVPARVGPLDGGRDDDDDDDFVESAPSSAKERRRSSGHSSLDSSVDTQPRRLKRLRRGREEVAKECVPVVGAKRRRVGHESSAGVQRRQRRAMVGQKFVEEEADVSDGGGDDDEDGYDEDGGGEMDSFLDDRPMSQLTNASRDSVLDDVDGDGANDTSSQGVNMYRRFDLQREALESTPNLLRRGRAAQDVEMPIIRACLKQLQQHHDPSELGKGRVGGQRPQQGLLASLVSSSQAMPSQPMPPPRPRVPPQLDSSKRRQEPRLSPASQAATVGNVTPATTVGARSCGGAGASMTTEMRQRIAEKRIAALKKREAAKSKRQAATPTAPMPPTSSRPVHSSAGAEPVKILTTMSRPTFELLSDSDSEDGATKVATVTASPPPRPTWSLGNLSDDDNDSIAAQGGLNSLRQPLEELHRESKQTKVCSNVPNDSLEITRAQASTVIATAAAQNDRANGAAQSNTTVAAAAAHSDRCDNASVVRPRCDVRDASVLVSEKYIQGRFQETVRILRTRHRLRGVTVHRREEMGGSIIDCVLSTRVCVRVLTHQEFNQLVNRKHSVSHVQHRAFDEMCGALLSRFGRPVVIVEPCPKSEPDLRDVHHGSVHNRFLKNLIYARGVRGIELRISANVNNTAAILFEVLRRESDQGFAVPRLPDAPSSPNQRDLQVGFLLQARGMNLAVAHCLLFAYYGRPLRNMLEELKIESIKRNAPGVENKQAVMISTFFKRRFKPTTSST